MLEHPAYSDAWSRFLLPAPPRSGGWVRGICGGWACHVEQWHYGHRAKKATWLYAFGLVPPPLRWGATPDTALVAYVTDGGGEVKRGRRPPALVSWCGNHTKAGEDRPRLGSKEASATPLGFRDELLSMARTVELMGHRERSATPPEFRDVLLTMAADARGNS